MAEEVSIGSKQRRFQCHVMQQNFSKLAVSQLFLFLQLLRSDSLRYITFKVSGLRGLPLRFLEAVIRTSRSVNRSIVKTIKTVENFRLRTKYPLFDKEYYQSYPQVTLTIQYFQRMTLIIHDLQPLQSRERTFEFSNIIRNLR